MDPSYRNPYTQQWNIGYAHQLNSYSVLEVDFVHVLALFFFFKQKTAYDITYGDWSSDVCSSDLTRCFGSSGRRSPHGLRRIRPALKCENYPRQIIPIFQARRETARTSDRLPEKDGSA